MPYAALSSLAVVCQQPEAWTTVDYGVATSQAFAEDVVLPIVAIALSFVAFLGFVWMRTRSRLHEKRFELIRELSANGNLTPETARELLHPESALARLFSAATLKTVILVLAWFGLLGGLAMTIAALVDGWSYRSKEVGVAGIAMGVISLATLTAPMALAEIRRRDVSA